MRFRLLAALAASTLALGWPMLTSAQSTGRPIVLPTRYDEHRFYVEPVTLDGTTLHLFTDTGGGLFLYPDVVEQLHLEVEKLDGRAWVSLPQFKPTATIPPPANDPRLTVAASNERPPTRRDWSGMLGQAWFADRVWTFDYPNRQLLLRAAGDLPPAAADHQVSLGFKINAAGKHGANYPRITVQIDGAPLDLLFDTGASTQLSDAALAVVKDDRPAIRAASFITDSVFAQWHARHPDWRTVEHGEVGTGLAMIEVPAVSVAGYTVGPVWFTARPDAAIHDTMSPMMDKQIEGALGGNALHFFRVSVDYPRAIAVFER